MTSKHIFYLLLQVFFITSYANRTDDTLKIGQLLKKSVEFQRTNQAESWRLADEACKLSEKINYKRGLADAYIRIGSLLYTNGNLDTSKKVTNKALALYSNLHFMKGEASAYLLMSYINFESGLKDSAFSAIYSALKIYQKTNDSLGIIQSYVQLGNLNLDYENTKAALLNFTKAAQLSKRIGESEGTMSSWDGLGRSFLKTKQYQKSLIYFVKLDSIYRQSGDIYSKAQNLTNIALCFELMGDFQKSKRYYQEALKACIKLKMKTGIALGYYNLGSNFLELNQPDSAIFMLKKSILISKGTNDPERISKSYILLAEAYAKKGLFNTAYQYHIMYSKLSDSILNSEKVKQIAEMQIKYDTEKKQQQIVLLDSQSKTKATQRNFFILSSILLLLLATSVIIGLIKTRKEKNISDALLLNILPAEVAKELKQKGSANAQFYDEVTVLFTDFKDFTQIAEKLQPSELVDILHFCFKAFDEIITRHHVEKIKTIGDSYMCAGGLPVPNKSSPKDVVESALEIQAFMKSFNEQRLKNGEESIEMRLGIHTGPVVAGIVGVKKFSYDIWGDTVNTASRMEQSGEAGRVNISETTYQQVKDKFLCLSRGKISAKHKGMIEMYFVEKML